MIFGYVSANGENGQNRQICFLIPMTSISLSRGTWSAWWKYNEYILAILEFTCFDYLDSLNKTYGTSHVLPEYLKLFMDGVVETETGALLKPYKDGVT